MKIKLDTEAIRYITLFETLTGAIVKDCIVEDNKILFIVKEGYAGIAIGKNGKNVKKLNEILNKEIEVLEFSEDPITFVSNIFKPLKVKNAYFGENPERGKILYIQTMKSHPLARSKLRKARMMLAKYFGINEVVLV